MSTPHQIIGFIVLAFIVIEAILGPAYLFRNRRNKTSDQKTSRPMHIFITTLGRLTLLLGCINGFLYVKRLKLVPLFLNNRGTNSL